MKPKSLDQAIMFSMTMGPMSEFKERLKRDIETLMREIKVNLVEYQGSSIDRQKADALLEHFLNEVFK